MDDSILNDIKKLLGLDPEYKAFDTDIIIYINSAIARLRQLGVGPLTGYRIQDETATWVAFLGPGLDHENIKTYIYMKVRMIFDVPATSFAINAINDQIKELEWLINVDRESTEYKNPLVTTHSGEGTPTHIVIDGGSS